MTPIVQVMKGGEDLMISMAPYFIAATITDAVGVENDQLEIELEDGGRKLPLPREDDELTVLAGYRETGVALAGVFAVQGWGSGWEGNGPETMTMTARAASYTKAVKAGGLKHFDEMTLGDILGETAKAAGLSLAIDPELGRIQLPYAIRWEASPIDFAVRIAAEAGGLVKPGGGKLSVVKKGSGRGAGGAELPPIRVTRRGSLGWRIDGEPRPRFGEVSAAWLDEKDGRRKIVTASTGKDGPPHAILHPRPTEAEAKRAAEARARDLTMLTGSGWFAIAYDPAATAGAFVEASGFGEGIDGRWVSETIETTFSKDGGAVSRINVTAPP